MKRIVLFLTILALFNQCDDNESWLADKRFSHALFTSEAECLAYQQHVFINCYRNVWFKTDGKMEIVFTDILTSGQYHQAGKKIWITLEHSFDSPQKFTFTIVSKEKLILDLDQSIWLLTE